MATSLRLANSTDDRVDISTAVPPVDPKGDVKLFTRRTQLLVSSKALAMGSKIFSTMFQPRFQEGVQLKEHAENNKIYTINLPDDHSMALHIVCLVLHHQPRNIPYIITPYLFFEVAKLADKYDCVDAIWYWAGLIMNGLFDHVRASNIPGKDYSLLLCAAVLFDNAYSFTDVSRIMVYACYNEPFTQTFDEAIHDYISIDLKGRLWIIGLIGDS